MKLEEAFFWRSPVQVAPDLIGCRLSHQGVTLLITETEAYLGPEDAASHARSGPTRRSGVMYGPVGRAYIYKSYGVHLCFNVVCHLPETGGAVLIRAGEVIDGRALAESRRGVTKGLADGPGKVSQCLDLSPHLDGISLFRGAISLARTSLLETDFIIVRGPRIGISQNVEKKYRFWLAESAHVSKPNRGGVPL